MAVAHRAAGQLGQFARADAVTAHELGFHAQLLHLADHRAGHGVHAAEEHDVGLGGLELGDDGREIGGLVVGELVAHEVAAGGLDALFELVGHALAIGCAVVDHRDVLALEFLHGIAAQRAAQVHVVSHHAEGGLEALAGELGVGRRGRDLRDAGVAVDLGGRDGGAGVQVADHAVDLGVDELLRGGSALLRVGAVVFGEQFELDLLATDRHALGVQIVDGHARTVLVVLAQVRDGAAGRRHVADLHDHVLCASGAGQQRECGQGQGVAGECVFHARSS